MEGEEIKFSPSGIRKISELITSKYMNIYSLADFINRNSHYINSALDKENFTQLNMTEKENLLKAIHYAAATAMFYSKKYKFEEDK